MQFFWHFPISLYFETVCSVRLYVWLSVVYKHFSCLSLYWGIWGIIDGFSTLRRVVIYGCFRLVAIITIIVAILVCENKSPPPTSPFISFSLRLTTLKSKLPHLERNDSAGQARQTLDVLRPRRKIMEEGHKNSFHRYMCAVLIFITYLPSEAFHTRLPWDLFLWQRDARLTHATASAATFLAVRGKISQNFSDSVWHRYRNHSDSHSLVFKEEA